MYLSNLRYQYTSFSVSSFDTQKFSTSVLSEPFVEQSIVHNTADTLTKYQKENLNISDTSIEQFELNLKLNFPFSPACYHMDSGVVPVPVIDGG